MSIFRIFAACGTVIVIGIAGCKGDSPTSPSAPPGPRATLADLAGNWAGKLDTGPVERCFGITWGAVSRESSVSGTSRVAFMNAGNTPFVAANAGVGTMTATASGDGFSISLEFPAGSFPRSGTQMTGNVLETPNCSMTATGTASASQTAMTGTVTLQWAQSCNGNLWPAGAPTTMAAGIIMTKESAGGRVPQGCQGSTGP